MVQLFAEVIAHDRYRSKIVFFYETLCTKVKAHLKDPPTDGPDIDLCGEEIVLLPLSRYIYFSLT